MATAPDDQDLDKNALLSQLTGDNDSAKGLSAAADAMKLPTAAATAPVTAAADAMKLPTSNTMPIGGGGQTFLSRDVDPGSRAANITPTPPAGIAGLAQSMTSPTAPLPPNGPAMGGPPRLETGTPTTGNAGVLGNAGAGAANVGQTILGASGTKDPAASAAGSTVQPSIFKGFTPKYAMEGFDFNREQNTGKSAKDAFAYLSQQAPPPPLNDKAALQAWTEQYIVPGMKQLGHDVSNVQGDKFHLKNWQGDFDVDYGRGAGAEGGALAWQVDDPTAKLSNAAYTPQGAAAQNPALLDAIGAGGGQGGDTNDKVKKEIEALIAGGNSPIDQNALLQQLDQQQV